MCGSNVQVHDHSRQCSFNRHTIPHPSLLQVLAHTAAQVMYTPQTPTSPKSSLTPAQPSCKNIFCKTPRTRTHTHTHTHSHSIQRGGVRHRPTALRQHLCATPASLPAAPHPSTYQQHCRAPFSASSACRSTMAPWRRHICCHSQAVTSLTSLHKTNSSASSCYQAATRSTSGTAVCCL
jgi:hypothetical protein